MAFKNWQAEQEKKGEVVDKEEVKEDKENKESKEEEHNIKDEGGLSVSYNKEEERSLIHLGAGGDRGQLVVERRGGEEKEVEEAVDQVTMIFSSTWLSRSSPWWTPTQQPTTP